MDDETDSPITYKEVKTVINNLKKGKASGPDNIINELIKYSKNVTIPCIVKLFNLILNTGIYPTSWQKSLIVLIHKDGDKNEPNNYRGVSLIDCLPKLFNAILNDRLNKKIETAISNCQFGFRKNHRHLIAYLYLNL